MGSRHEQFDEKKLFDRKNKFCGYTYCPLCGGKMSPRQVDGRRRVACNDESCGFVFYQNPVPAAGAIVVEKDAILLVRRAHPPKIGWWCLPAGFMEWDEHPSRTAIREVLEETGLEIRLRSFFEVYSGNDDPRNNAILILYLADKIGGTLAPNDDADEVRFFSLDELPDKIAFEAHRQALADYEQRIRASR